MLEGQRYPTVHTGLVLPAGAALISVTAALKFRAGGILQVKLMPFGQGTERLHTLSAAGMVCTLACAAACTSWFYAATDEVYKENPLTRKHIIDKLKTCAKAQAKDDQRVHPVNAVNAMEGSGVFRNPMAFL